MEATSMLPALIAVVLSSGPNVTAPESGVGGELIATWVHEEKSQSISISLDADGHCSVVAHDELLDVTRKSLCGYWIVGSRIYLRAKVPSGTRPVLEAEFDRDTNQLIVDGEPKLVFDRQPIDQRRE